MVLCTVYVSCCAIYTCIYISMTEVKVITIAQYFVVVVILDY